MPKICCRNCIKTIKPRSKNILNLLPVGILGSPWKSQTCVCHSLSANLKDTDGNALKIKPQTATVQKLQV